MIFVTRNKCYRWLHQAFQSKGYRICYRGAGAGPGRPCSRKCTSASCCLPQTSGQLIKLVIHIFLKSACFISCPTLTSRDARDNCWGSMISYLISNIRSREWSRSLACIGPDRFKFASGAPMLFLIKSRC